MNDLQLQSFLKLRAIAAHMAGAPTNWQWIGRHMSQRMFGITEKRAKQYAASHGGDAAPMS